MKIECLVLGDYQTNCYVVRESDQAVECLVIDAGYSAEVLVEFLEREELAPKRILLTHAHADHVAGIGLMKKRFSQIPVWIGREEVPVLTDDTLNLSLLSGEPLQLDEADEIFETGDVITFGSMAFRVLSTPGHTQGGVSFYSEQAGVVFSGDALFCGSIGRTDLPGGDYAQLIASIQEQLLVLPDETVVYSGHGPATTIGDEKRSNAFLVPGG